MGDEQLALNRRERIAPYPQRAHLDIFDGERRSFPIALRPSLWFMRRLSQLLTGLGVVVGGLVGVGMLLPIHLVGVSWLIAVGLAKLTFLGSLGLIGGGAVLGRIANRNEAAERILPPGAQ